ncbi:MAG: hypothetical protein IPM57_10250 [Oligoflexia bacterium]|nr:hypothetical protein [Oligoflexia bacterium]
MKQLFLCLIIFLLTLPTLAEYRAYRLGIKYHPENPDDEEKEVITSLDNYQYETYFKITPFQQTRIISHWRCKGRTDYHTPYCTDPKELKLQQDEGLAPTQNVRTPASN